MADTTFVNNATPIVADWLNDVNDKLYHLNLGNSDRSLTSKLQDFVSVDDFGAVGDNTTDDLASVQAAIDSVKDEDIKIIVSDTQAYKIAGNAISVNVMQYLLKSIFEKSEIKTSIFDFVDAIQKESSKYDEYTAFWVEEVNG